MVVATIPVGDAPIGVAVAPDARSEEHTSELQSRSDLVCRLLLEKKKKHCRRETTARCPRTRTRSAAGPRRGARSGGPAWESADLRQPRLAWRRPLPTRSHRAASDRV